MCCLRGGMRGKMRTRIIGTGSCLPETIVTNDNLSQIMDTSDEWISSRTGIRERRLARVETTAAMSAAAAKKAMKGNGVKAVASDINAACSGFMFALHIADAYIKSGIYRTALVLGAETLSKIMDWNDRSTCVLFGDGAGAAVVRSGETGLLAYDQGSDGARGMVLTCRNRKNNNPFIKNSTELSYIHMDGQEVYRFAVTTVPASIRKVVGEAGLSIEDIDYFALHQANIRIIRSVAKRLKVPEDKFPTSLDHCGNVSAASVPILLDEMNRKGMLKAGMKIVLSGFGGGLTWGSAVIEW